MADLSSDYPESIVEGLTGAVIRTPFKGSFPLGPTRRDLERGALQPDISYRMSRVVETYDPLEFKSLEMGLLSSQQILDMSKVEVISAGAFQDNESFSDQTPILNGVHDLRMGAFDTKGDKCRTCNLGVQRAQRSPRMLRPLWSHQPDSAYPKATVSRNIKVRSSDHLPDTFCS